MNTNYAILVIADKILHCGILGFFPLWPYSPIQALAASMKLSVSLQFLDLVQSVGFLGLVMSSLQGLYLCTNTKHPCLEWGTHGLGYRDWRYTWCIDYKNKVN
jgi:hypothetical protein